jgi:hypothetical protein
MGPTTEPREPTPDWRAEYEAWSAMVEAKEQRETTMTNESQGQKRIIPVADAPAGIRRLAGETTEVVEWTNPDGTKVYWFILDGEETKVAPATMGR